MPELFRAREDFQATLNQTAELLDIDVIAVEKDYWVCQVLRELATGERGKSIVFKGGTSLEKLRLSERFSEDIDALVLVPQGLSKKAHERYLKTVVQDSVVEGITPDDKQISGGNPGSFHRRLYLTYRERVTGTSGIVDEGRILLELGESGGPHPNLQHDVTTLVARQLIAQGTDVTGFDDLDPFPMTFLHPGRTLLEKLLRVESFVQAPEQAAQTEWSRIGRQMYDIWALLADQRVLALLADRPLVGEILENAATISQAFSSRPAQRPDGGFALSGAYDPSGAWADRLEREHDTAIEQMYYGSQTPPTFADGCQRVAAHATLL